MNPFVILIVKYVLPVMSWLITRPLPGRRAAVAWREAKNKARIMESVLRHGGENDPDRDFFVNGVQSSMRMRCDTSANDRYIQPFVNRNPSGDPALARLWERDIRQPCEQAIGQIYPVLKQKQRLEEVSYYQSLPELVEQHKNG